MELKRALTIACVMAAWPAMTASIASAADRECKTEAVTAEGDVASLRDLGAYPNSLFAWRSAVKEKFGAEWNSWRYAKDQKVDCREVKTDKMQGWICKRTAYPCQDTLSMVVGKAEKSLEKRTCKDDPLTSTGSAEKTEANAISEAKSGWSIDVRGKFGSEWAKWDNASKSDYDCHKVGSKTQCIAVAIPCKAK